VQDEQLVANQAKVAGKKRPTKSFAEKGRRGCGGVTGTPERWGKMTIPAKQKKKETLSRGKHAVWASRHSREDHLTKKAN